MSAFLRTTVSISDGK